MVYCCCRWNRISKMPCLLHCVSLKKCHHPRPPLKRTRTGAINPASQSRVSFNVKRCSRLMNESARTKFSSSIASRNVATHARSEEHTSELQSRLHLVCRLL